MRNAATGRRFFYAVSTQIFMMVMIFDDFIRVFKQFSANHNHHKNLRPNTIEKVSFF